MCLSPTNDGSVGTNDMPAALDHRLEVRTQKNTSCSKTEISIIADGRPAGDWLLVNLCEDAKRRCNCAFAVGKYKTSPPLPDDARPDRTSSDDPQRPSSGDDFLRSSSLADVTGHPAEPKLNLTFDPL